MTIKSQINWGIGFGALFALANSFAIYLDNYLFLLFPLVLIFIWMAFFAMDKLILAIVFFTPLSLNLESIDLGDVFGGIGFYLPTEPLLFGILVIYWWKLLLNRDRDLEISNHPLSIAISVYLLWIFATCITSEMPAVSLKFFLTRLWFIIPIYFLSIKLFKKERNIKGFIWLYVISLSIVVIYTFIRHAMNGFAEEPAHWVMTPFFKDHTSYGAILAMFLPITIGMMFNSKIVPSKKLFIGLLNAILVVGIIFSYTRAAWVSLIGALGVYLLIKFRIKISLLILGGILAGGVLAVNWDQIVIRLEKNTTDSSDDFGSHVESMSNISSDDSNLERINRWNSAIKMWKERPVVGWGPGTYVFQYAPFQDHRDLTMISTNFGDLGNAHSEYLGPLAESGLPGLLTVLAIVIVFYWKAINTYYAIKDPQLRGVVMSLILGLTTYFIHGVLNNYLDTDKASIPVWGFMAMIVAIDLYHKDKTFNKSLL